MASTDDEIQRLAMQHLARAVQPTSTRAFWGEFVPTLALVIGTWTVSALVFHPRIAAQSRWWLLPWGVGCATLSVWLVRAFVVMHDAGHGALAPARWLNLLIGHGCSVFVFTPMLHWSALHWNHHRTTGNLEEQDGIGDTYTMTVRQYLALSQWQRWLYRIFRHPATCLLVVPSVIFFINHRLPVMWFRRSRFPAGPLRGWHRRLPADVGGLAEPDPAGASYAAAPLARLVADLATPTWAPAGNAAMPRLGSIVGVAVQGRAGSNGALAPHLGGAWVRRPPLTPRVCHISAPGARTAQNCP